MKKKNGFVLLETVVTICILSSVLLSLYGTYSYILRKSLARNTYDLTDSIYSDYYITDIISKNNTSMSNYITNECANLNPGYECDISDESNSIHYLNQVYEIEKIYVINPKEFIDNHSYLNKLDATTIDYVKSFGNNINKDYYIFKYKKIYENGTYEIFHSRMEV